MSTSQSVHVDLGARSYDIVIADDALTRAADFIMPHLHTQRVAIITDETVMGLHGATLKTTLEHAGITAHFIIRPPGENQKSFKTLQIILNALLDLEFDRKDTVIAFGGGVIGDLTGFAASIYKRGCQFMQIPTTLLAQVDSSVGGKTAINVAQGKNLIGAFYQRKLVLADMSVLSTLPEREFKAGYAEVLKYGLLGDAEFFTWLEDNGFQVLQGKTEFLAHAIAVSCQTKARIVSEDEQENGRRALLNLGHTFGHALEAETGYSGDLLHGEAVSAGMMMAYAYSQSQKLCSENDVARLAHHLDMTGLTRLQDIAHLLHNPDRLLAHMDQDKKNEGGALTLILARGIGDAFIQKNAPRDSVHTFLKTLSQTHA